MSILCSKINHVIAAVSLVLLELIMFLLIVVVVVVFIYDDT